jgi:hypothetical protein
MLHDVGKASVPPELLDKRTTLERDEWYRITKHPVASSKMLRAQDMRVEVISAALSHHEWYNGKGYPLGLAGEAIPLAARVLSLADAYDAMSSDRPYRSALPPARIRDEIVKGAGGQFDPGLVRDLLPLLELGVDADATSLKMRVVSDDPALLQELWFGAYPLGWNLEVWPAEWAALMPGSPGSAEDALATILELGNGIYAYNGKPDLTVIDGRSVRRLPEGALDQIPSPVLWIDPVPQTIVDSAASTMMGSRQPDHVLSRPLDLADMHAALKASLYVGTREQQKHSALRVLIADPYHLFRQVLRRGLERWEDVLVVAEASSPHDFREARRTYDYDVAVIASDLIAGTHSTSPLSLSGELLDRIEMAESVSPRKPAVVLVADEDLEDYSESVDPTRVYIHRGAPLEELVDALARVARRTNAIN